MKILEEPLYYVLKKFEYIWDARTKCECWSGLLIYIAHLMHLLTLSYNSLNKLHKAQLISDNIMIGDFNLPGIS